MSKTYPNEFAARETRPKKLYIVLFLLVLFGLVNWIAFSNSKPEQGVSSYRAESQPLSLDELFRQMAANKIDNNAFKKMWNGHPPRHVVRQILAQANQGEFVPQTLACWMFLDGTGVPKDERRAANYCKEAAEQDYVMAQFYTGYMLETGRGVEPDLDLAIEYYTIAASKNNLTAKYNLGRIYAFHPDYSDRQRDGFELIEETANSGYSRAQDQLGSMAHHGGDNQIALAWFNKAAANGYGESMFNIGHIYFDGHGSPVNISLGREWFEKAAQHGHGKSAWYLGLKYQHPPDGSGETPDFKKAVEWYRKGAALGNSAAQYSLYDLTTKKDLPGLSRREGLVWLRAAAMGGHDEAQSELGAVYARGDAGLDKDMGKAAQWLANAFFQGNTGAEMYLLTLHNGQGYQESFQPVIEMLKLRGDLGDTASLNQLALYYLRGNGVDRSMIEAAKHYRKAALLGDMEATMQVAEMYTWGYEELPQNLEAAKELYLLAAAKGYHSANFYIGQMYEKGMGVKANKSKAYMWYVLAGQDFLGAQKKLSALDQELPEMAKIRARKEAAVCRLSQFQDQVCSVI